VPPLDGQIEMLKRTETGSTAASAAAAFRSDHCALYNPRDRAARGGSGPRYLLGDNVEDFEEQ
jgi:MerR family redox-sensitive transcriptional activator SoxR